jgi:hypothetical protein
LVLTVTPREDKIGLKKRNRAEPLYVTFKNLFEHLLGDNCLHCAVSSPFAKRKSIVETLCRKGCNLNEKNKEYLTPLHIATGPVELLYVHKN